MIVGIDCQAVDLLLHRHIAEFFEMSWIVFLKDGNGPVVTGNVNTFQTWIECNDITAFGLREIGDGLMRIETKDGHEVVLFAGKEGQPVFAVESHAVIAFAFAHRVFDDLFVGCRIDFGDYVLVLQVHINAPGNGIITRITGLALKVKSCDNLVVVHVHYGFSMSAFVRNIDFMKWRRVGNAVGL